MRYFILIAAMLLCAVTEAATVVVISVPPKAEILMGTKVVGKTPCRLSLPDGNHSIMLKAESYVDLVHTFEVSKRLVMLKLRLKPKTYSVDIVFKEITESTTGWWVVHANAVVGEVPGTTLLPKGQQRITLIKSGFRDIGVTIPVAEENQLVELQPPVRGPGSFRRIEPLIRFVGAWAQTPVDPAGARIFQFEPNGLLTLTTPHRTYGFVWELSARGEVLCKCDMPGYEQSYVLKLKQGRLVGKRAATMPGDWNLVKQ